MKVAGVLGSNSLAIFEIELDSPQRLYKSLTTWMRFTSQRCSNQRPWLLGPLSRSRHLMQRSQEV